MSEHTPAHDADEGSTHRAGAFDIRNFIGALIGIYGVVLVIVGLVGTNQTQLDKANGMNINIYAGIGMVLVAAFFITWARLRPVVVPAEHEESTPSGH